MAITADLYRYYGVDLEDVVHGRGPSPGTVLALVEGLPVDAAFAASAAASQNGGSADEWRAWQSNLQTNLLLAELIDFTREGTKAQVGRKYRLDPHPRPGDKPAQHVLSVADINRHRNT